MKRVKRKLLGQLRWLAAVGLLRLELLALSAIDREAGRHWRSDLNWDLLLYLLLWGLKRLERWLLLWGLIRLERSETLLCRLNTEVLLRGLLLRRKTIWLKVKCWRVEFWLVEIILRYGGRVELWHLLGKIILRYEGSNNIFSRRLYRKFVCCQFEVWDLHITKCSVTSVEMWRRNTVH